MLTLAVFLAFGWLFFKGVGLAFRVTWCAAKVVATLLFVIALPLVVLAVVGGLLSLLVPLALVAAAFGILKSIA